MDIKIQAKTAEHIYHIVSRKPFEPAVKFSPTKKEYNYIKNKSPFVRKAPEEVGISSAHMLKFVNELENATDCNIHQFMVVKDNFVICEGAMAPFKRDMWHVTHSMCKTVTAMAIGILITDGKLTLDDKLVKIFDDICPPLSKIKLGKITVKHLLTMSSGVILNESVLVAETDWLKAYLDTACHFEPGTKFQYNSINSYILSCIVGRITGVTMFDFLKEKLFKPLGIENICWESCPSGRTKGGWGMYITPEDMAKLGAFLMGGGKCGGKEIISTEYIAQMTAKQIDTPENEGAFGYGFQTWVGKREGSYLFNGMLGQNIHCMPDINTIVVVTGGNDKLFGNCKTNEIIYKYFAGLKPSKAPLKKNITAEHNLRLKQATVRSKVFADFVASKKTLSLSKKLTNIQRDTAAIADKEYESERIFLRIQPLFAQMLNNSYSVGINKISFSLKGNTFFFSVFDGDTTTDIPVGFDDFIQSTIDINGEKYTVAAMGKFTVDEDNVKVLKISLPFLEHSNGRKIKIFFIDDENIRLEWSEIPGKTILSAGADMLMGNMSDLVTKEINAKVDMDMIFDLADIVMEPTVTAKLIK